MTLLVRDEQDILEANLRYHLARGVDFVIATDNLSVDGTRDILREHERAGRMRIIDQPHDTYAQSDWVTRMARLAATEHGADWVINSDADEFWWPVDGELKSTLAAIDRTVGVIEVPRFDFVPRSEHLGPWYERMVIRDLESRNALGSPLPGKVCHRADPAITVAQGNHSVHGTHLLPLVGEPPIIIFHFPARTYAQFSRKIGHGGRAYRNNPQRGHGGTWLWLYDRLLAGELPSYYAGLELTDQAIEAGIARGALDEDTRLRDTLLPLMAAGATRTRGGGVPWLLARILRRRGRVATCRES